MSVLPISTVPSARAFGTVSCMRFRQRTKVDLPHPEGPMMAVAWLAGISSEILWRAWVEPNQALSFETWTPTPMLVSSLEHAAAREDANGGGGNDDQHDENQGSCPSLAMPIIKGGDGVNE